MKRLLWFVSMISLAIVVLVFTVKNSQDVTFSFYIGSVNMPLSLLLAITLACGALLGVAASLLAVMRAKRELRKARKQARVKQQELENLRAIPFQDKA